MKTLKLSESPKPAVPAWKRENPSVVPGTLPMVRELGQLIADIRRERARLDAAGLTDEPVRMEHVVGNDPRD